jgi:UDP-N-acetylmuramate: L-alanyl-gamma-D-glutamyl-meso-diaminopimelate ligase
MGGLAALAREAGHKVTGCDTGVYPPMSAQLRDLGIDLVEGFAADQMQFQPDMYVIGNVVSRARLTDGSPKFPLMEAILESGAPYTSGPQWLCDHVLHHPSNPRHVMAVAGTHGKTTTTAMLTWILQSAGLQPGFLVGGVPLNFGISARLGLPSAKNGNGQIQRTPFVIEADEYDTTFFDKRSKFVHYRPRTAILNNLEFDHADIFDNLGAIERQFHHLVRTVPASGRLVVNADEESLKRVLDMGNWSGVSQFGVGQAATKFAQQTSDPRSTNAQNSGSNTPNNANANTFWSIQGPPNDFAVVHQGKELARVRWDITGVHNQLNALAAIIAAEHVGVPVPQAAEALASFQNVRRRMEVRGTVARAGGVITVYDDFAHHPTAIRTTLDGLRRKVGPNARILAVFEPRSNTMKLGTMKSQLPWSLEEANLAICHSGGLDWDARETLAEMGARAQVGQTVDEVIAQVVAAAKTGDHVLCMSNGGFGGIHDKLLKALG